MTLRDKSRRKMARLSWTILVVLPIAACTQVADQVSGAAESTRTATEQMAAKTRDANRKRETALTEISAPVREKNAMVLGERFILRAEGDGWSVVDLTTGDVSNRAGSKLENLDLESAKRALEDLNLDARERARGYRR